MLVLSTLHRLLSHVLSHPHLHTAVLFTPAGELVCVASSDQRPKDDVRVLVGLSGEIWRETKETGYGMAESELGRITVVPVEDDAEDHVSPQPPDVPPLLLIALNGTANVEWSELRSKSRALAGQLAKPLGKYARILGESAAYSSSSQT